MNQDLQTIQEHEFEGSFPSKKDLSEIIHSSRSRAVSYFESLIQSLERNDLLELMSAIDTRLKQLKQPRIRKASSKEFNEISLFSDDKQRQSSVNSPLLRQQSWTDEKKPFDPELQFKNATSLQFSRTHSVGESFYSTRSNLAEKRGNAMKIITTINKKNQNQNYYNQRGFRMKDTELLEAMSPSFRIGNTKKSKIQKIQKKNTLLSKFKSKIGVEIAERNITEIKEVEKMLSLRTRKTSQSLYPLILGVIGLLCMLQIYLF